MESKIIFDIPDNQGINLQKDYYNFVANKSDYYNNGKNVKISKYINNEGDVSFLLGGDI